MKRIAHKTELDTVPATSYLHDSDKFYSVPLKVSLKVGEGWCRPTMPLPSTTQVVSTKGFNFPWTTELRTHVTHLQHGAAIPSSVEQGETIKATSLLTMLVPLKTKNKFKIDAYVHISQ